MSDYWTSSFFGHPLYAFQMDVNSQIQQNWTLFQVIQLVENNNHLNFCPLAPIEQRDIVKSMDDLEIYFGSQP